MASIKQQYNNKTFDFGYILRVQATLNLKNGNFQNCNNNSFVSGRLSIQKQSIRKNSGGNAHNFTFPPCPFFQWLRYNCLAFYDLF